MEQVQQKRGLRIVAAIMFILVCAIQVAMYIWSNIGNTYIFRGDNAAKNIVSLVSHALIYSIAIYACVGAGLFAKKKSNGLRFTFGAIFAVLLIVEIVLVIGEYPFKLILRENWIEYLMLLAAAACLFAFKRISVAGVGFSMLAWLEMKDLLSVLNGRHGIDWASAAAYMLMLTIFVLAAVVCFLNDSEKVRSAAKPLGIVAIVLLGIGFVLTEIGLMRIVTNARRTEELLRAILSLLLSLFLFLGTLFAMIAIAFRKKQTAKKAAGIPPYQQYQPYQVPPQYAQPYQAYGQQPYQPAQPQYQPAQPPYQPAQPQYQQPQQEPVREQAEQEAQGGDYRDLDFEQYAPLDAGVSMKPDKDYKFHRAEGFVGSLPQKFIDRTFIKCPICCSAEPNWTISQHNQMSWKGNLYLFKCSHCNAVISMSMPDVTTLGNGGAGVAANPSVGLTNLMVKAKSGKEVGAVYAVIESVGNSGVNPACQGKEFKLEQLQKMSLRV